MENEIEKIWKNLLNIEDFIDRESSFFEVGGDSLLLINFLNIVKEFIKEAYNIEREELLKIFFENNSIRSFSNAIEKYNENNSNVDGESTNSTFMIIKEADNHSNNSNTVVLFSDGLGELTIYERFIDKLKKSGFCGEIVGYTLKPISSLIENEKFLIEELGEYVAKDLRRRYTGKRNKLILLGHCFGGAVAIETSRRMSEKEFKHSLVVVDSKRWKEKYLFNDIVLEYIMSYLWGIDLLEEGYFVDFNILKKYWQSNPFDIFADPQIVCQNIKSNYPESMNDKFEKLYCLNNELRLKKILEISPAFKDAIENMEEEYLKKIFNILKKNYKALYSYAPKDYNVDVIEFIPHEDDILVKSKLATYERFLDLINGAKIKRRIIEGDHISCINKDESLEAILKELEYLYEELKKNRTYWIHRFHRQKDFNTSFKRKI